MDSSNAEQELHPQEEQICNNEENNNYDNSTPRLPPSLLMQHVKELEKSSAELLKKALRVKASVAEVHYELTKRMGVNMTMIEAQCKELMEMAKCDGIDVGTSNNEERGRDEIEEMYEEMKENLKIILNSPTLRQQK